MPFKDGVWEVPSPTELAEFTDKLVNPAAHENPVELPEEIQKRLLNYASTQEINNREIENQKLYSLCLSLATDSQKISIIMPIYNALTLAKKCLHSILDRTHWPYELIIINDASPDKEVARWLKDVEVYYCHDALLKGGACKRLKILTNKKNRGFAATVNRGIREATGQYICLMNSDVLVTDKWATKMTIALEADPSHVIVNPCTNNTALINVPMQPGTSYLDMNRALERSSRHEHPEIMPVGFCFMFRKSLINDIGYFDEAFRNYGEETDYWFKALQVSDPDGKYRQNKAILADDCYTFHQRGSSFTSLGQETHMGLRKGASERFHMLHPKFQEWRKSYNPEAVLAKLRTRLPNEFYNTNFKYSIAWVVKSPKFCGGMKFIADIVNEMIEKGVNAQVCVIKNPEADEEYLGELHTAPIFFENATEFVNDFSTRVFENGIVVAAVSELVPPVQELIKSHEYIQGMHHVQSFDPYLVQNDKKLAMKIADLYTQLPFSVVSSNWIKEILDQHQISSTALLPGIDKDLFHPGNRDKGDDRFTIMMPIISKYWFKGGDRAIAIAKELFKVFEENNEEIRIMAYGVHSVPEVPNLICLGELTQARIATLLQTEVDAFVEPSYVHSYGMPAAEALASGVRVFSWDNRGINDVSKVGTSVFDNNTTAETIAKAIYKLKKEIWHPFLAEIPDRNVVVNDFIDIIESKYLLHSESYKINVVTPHARKHGGPTTIINLANILRHLGHDTKLVANYSDFSTEVLKMCQTEIYIDWENAPKCDLMIINSDNPFAEEMMANQPDAKKVMLKLSHNARFKSIEEGNLRLPHWDHIITSTNIMKEAAMHPHDGWRHRAWPEEKVDRIGWYHYSHPQFDCPIKNRTFGNIDTKIVLGTLIHAHPMKGSKMVLAVMDALRKKYGEKIICVGIGECVMKPKPEWLNYIYTATRLELASVFRQIDIWIGASHTEGLGRMPLELMSSGAAIVNSDTGTEFLEHEKNCLIYPIENSQACAEAVDRLIQDPALFTSLCLAGHKTAVEHGSSVEYVTNISQAISKIMGEK